MFLTNHFGIPALTVCALYKSRWQVELFFKWIKQHLRVKRFFGTSENAVKSQVWIAVATYVLVAIVRKAAESRFLAACDAADFKRDAFRENPFNSAVF